jgi:hypothetical protein
MDIWNMLVMYDSGDWISANNWKVSNSIIRYDGANLSIT